MYCFSASDLCYDILWYSNVPVLCGPPASVIIYLVSKQLESCTPIHKHTETSTSFHLLPPYKSCSSESLLAWTRCQRLSMYSSIMYSYSFPIFWGCFLGASSKMLHLKPSSNHRNNHPNIGDLYVYCAMGAYREGVAFTLSAIDPTFSPLCNCHGRQEVGDSMPD